MDRVISAIRVKVWKPFRSGTIKHFHVVIVVVIKEEEKNLSDTDNAAGRRICTTGVLYRTIYFSVCLSANLAK